MRSGQREQDGTRTIVGAINTDGTIGNGSGFVCAKTAAGDYTIRFVPPFRGVPSVALSFGPATNAAGRWQSVASDSMRILAYSSSTGTLQDTAFGFHARGLPLCP